MTSTNNIITVIKGARLIEESITDKDIHDKFLRDFSATFDNLMKDKKYLYISCEGFEWVHIYDTAEQLNEMFSRQGTHYEEGEDFGVEQITKEITYNEFLEKANGEQMNFGKYSLLGSDLIFDF